jgi:hypothetical protein
MLHGQKLQVKQICGHCWWAHILPIYIISVVLHKCPWKRSLWSLDLYRVGGVVSSVINSAWDLYWITASYINSWIQWAHNQSVHCWWSGSVPLSYKLQFVVLLQLQYHLLQKKQVESRNFTKYVHEFMGLCFYFSFCWFFLIMRCRIHPCKLEARYRASSEFDCWISRIRSFVPFAVSKMVHMALSYSRCSKI